MTEHDAAANEAAGNNVSDEDAREPVERAEAEGAELEALKAEAEQNWNKYLRSVAELENLRRRNARDVENARKFGVERLVAAILPVRDSLEAALKAASEADADSLEVATLLEGDRATLRLLDQALEGAGIEEIDPEGEPFDPERHEAMSMLPSPTAEPNSVITVVQKGYALHERIVRPARVIVAMASDGQGDA